ncbi:MAG: hypothetical protein F6J87_28150, partial [Spirulina sp. SIO3F2]|nr:hypothetical protein [Spirulina sp. SIO3F2]
MNFRPAVLVRNALVEVDGIVSIDAFKEKNEDGSNNPEISVYRDHEVILKTSQ